MSLVENGTVKHFKKWANITLVFVYLVITAGAVVRATGSGMGCPDWPKCFGSWIPPTDASQLPADYKEKYSQEHFSVAEFNVYQTWTEYLNRLCGALLGMVALIACFFGFRIRKTHKKQFLLAILGVLLIGFEAWLGKTVVDSNLAPLKITTHMVVALVIVGVYLLIIGSLKDQTTDFSPGTITQRLLYLALSLTLVQVILGTQVREAVDEINVAMGNKNRSMWSDLLGNWFLIHRSFSIAVVILNLFIYFNVRNTPFWPLMNLVMIIILIEAGLGIVISYMGFPAWAQPIHLILAAVMFGLQFAMISGIRKKMDTEVT